MPRKRMTSGPLKVKRPVDLMVELIDQDAPRSLTLRQGGGHPDRLLHRTRLAGGPLAYSLAEDSAWTQVKGALGDFVRHPLSRKARLRRRAIRDTKARMESRMFRKPLEASTPPAFAGFTILNRNGYLAEEADSITYRKGHALAEFFLHPKRFRRLATPQTAETIAAMVGLLWEQNISHGHPHCGNVLYFKGNFGLIDWKLSHYFDGRVRESSPREIVRELFFDLHYFGTVLENFAVQNPAAWPEPRRQFESAYSSLLGHLKLPAAVHQRALERIMNLKLWAPLAVRLYRKGWI